VLFITANARRPVFTCKEGLELNGITGPYGRFFMPGPRPGSSPLAHKGGKPMEHPGEELVHLLEGRLEFEIDGETFTSPRATRSTSAPTTPPLAEPGREPAWAVWMALWPM
jgi:hypothetical protein